MSSDNENQAADDFESLLNDVASCRVCAADLPLGPRPVLQISPTARILVASQAPGRKVHQSGIPFDDDSGRRLRDWMGVSPEQFYNPDQIAILPMGLCYPGKGTGGDKPPRPECAPLWRDRIIKQLPQLSLVLLVGAYAQNHHLPAGTVTEHVRNYQTYLPNFFPLPHPSWRSRIWAEKNPWFEERVIPHLHAEISNIMNR